MHAPCDSDRADAAFASVFDVADRVCDENDLLAGRNRRLFTLAIGWRAIAAHHVGTIREKAPDARALVLLDIAAEHVRETIRDILVGEYTPDGRDGVGRYYCQR